MGGCHKIDIKGKGPPSPSLKRTGNKPNGGRCIPRRGQDCFISFASALLGGMQNSYFFMGLRSLKKIGPPPRLVRVYPYLDKAAVAPRPPTGIVLRHDPWSAEYSDTGG